MPRNTKFVSLVLCDQNLLRLFGDVTNLFCAESAQIGNHFGFWHTLPRRKKAHDLEQAGAYILAALFLIFLFVLNLKVLRAVLPPEDDYRGGTPAANTADSTMFHKLRIGRSQQQAWYAYS